VPPDRWNVERFYDSDPDKLGKIQTDSGGFIDDMAMFDASYFQVGPREAEVMDPLQRHMLEVQNIKI